MNQPHYETSDKYLGSFLLSHGAALVGRARASKRRVVFRFVANERLHELLQVYRSLAPVGLVPLRLFAARRCLKRLARTCKLEARAKPEVGPSATPAAGPDLRPFPDGNSPAPSC